ncbi:MAG: GtrA family protein [Fibrobacter sp.]|nr:GtrA family protein [Fibrobacter sp.]
MPKREALLGQLWRYCITGGVAFALDFGLFALFLYVCDLHYLLANLFGLVGGLVVNYLISIGWVFTACERNFEKKKAFEFFLFSLIGILGVGLNQLLMWLMVGVMEWWPMVSKMIAAILVLMWNFGGRKLLLFRVKKEPV